MANFEFRLPDVGEGTTEAEIGEWHVAPGSRIEEDQALVDVLTDKASVEMTSPVAGVVIAIHGNPGDRMAVGSVLAEIELDAAHGTLPAASTATPATPSPAAALTPAAPSPTAGLTPAAPSPTAGLTPAAPSGTAALTPAAAAGLASPATRQRARALNIALDTVPGTGPGGRVTDADLDGFVAALARRQPAQGGLQRRDAVHETKIIGLRRAIARSMTESKRRIPHFTYVEEFDLTDLEALRHELNEHRAADQPKLTLLPFFMRALARLVPEFPRVNARYDDEAEILSSYEAVHVGIATQTEGGLVVPVVRHVEALDLWACAREMLRVTTAARSGSAVREELSGSTITLTSLGALGGIAATPIINHPEVAILGPNKLVERPVVRSGAITVRTMMNLSAAFDHRIVDGYDAARFVQRFKRLIEMPALLFI
jgi:2-oxoisovalerate dehydrogenase E2 component (dihydrolipoyl transacylase)